MSRDNAEVRLFAAPDRRIAVRDAFGIDTDMNVPAFSHACEYTPAIDSAYRFDADTTLAVLAGFAHNRRVLLQGAHGTGKSTHIEQVAARLNWACLRVNLDGDIGRIDLLGRDAIAIRDGRQITEFREGILPWALQRSVALVFDEYDAGRAEVLFVLQRVLEADGALTLLDQNRVLEPHGAFRLFATANTLGLGDASGAYQGTQPLNQGQLDRWHIVARLDYLPVPTECAIVAARVPEFAAQPGGEESIRRMVTLAGLTRTAFEAGDLSAVMSPRTVISWAQNAVIFGSVRVALRLSFLNRCEPAEQAIAAELYQRCFDDDIGDDPIGGR